MAADATGPRPASPAGEIGGEATQEVATTLTGARGRAVRRNGAPNRIGRFVLVDKIGAGGMGAVYSAFDPKLERLVAIKLLGLERLPAGQDVANHRLLREARAMAQLSHPNVLPVFEVDQTDQGVFIAMELVKGGTLREWCNAKSRTWKQIVRMFEQAGRGLLAAHGRGLVHRDFKPDNVMVGEDGRARVMDFGLVRRAENEAPDTNDDRIPPGSESSAAPREALTATRGMLGTPAYMSPEQFRGDEPDHRADQFSFCVALWEALFGERPFQGRTIPELAAAGIGAVRPRLRSSSSTPSPTNPGSSSWGVCGCDTRQQPTQSSAPATMTSTMRRTSLPQPGCTRSPGSTNLPEKRAKQRSRSSGRFLVRNTLRLP